MSEASVSRFAVLALGVTQIVGYGTLYYSYAILAPAIAAELAMPLEWVFGILSAALLAGALVAPLSGKLADRFGAARLMVGGSAAAAAALLICALAPGRIGFAIGVFAMEITSCFVLYATAFVALVQIGGRNAQLSITHLTLIAGFASTLFWPLTSALHEHLGWREILVVFAALNLVLCLPLHVWVSRRSRRQAIGSAVPAADLEAAPPVPVANVRWSRIFVLLLVGFALEGFVLSAVLVQMVPLLTSVGLGAGALVVGIVFGPSQVASRLINMLFGNGFPQTWLAVLAATSLAAGLTVLLMTAPTLAGGILFAILFGFGSGLTSIVGGTLPLELFGRAGYGANVGWLSAARQFASAFAPFGLSLMIGGLGVFAALWILAAIAAVGVGTFVAISLTHQRGARRLA